MKTRPLLLMMLLLLAMTACQKQSSRKTLESGNAVYYWRTDLRLDSTERAFLAQYHINKVYCRYFDVVMNDDGEPKPNATISFSDTLPDSIEVIPTVYITEDCMHQAHEDLAERIVKRIRQMNETNGIRNVHEIQIDCDYTSKSRKRYYAFLEEIRKFWDDSNSSQTSLSSLSSESSESRPARISTTIRLHQLAMPVPPVDYGALMIYNTGDPRKWQARNPILDFRDVEPYLRRLDGYSLPLAAAYPVFQWTYTVQGVRVDRTVEAEEILQVKRAMESERSDLNRLILTYHLDKDNIDRYKPETYEEIYHH